MKFFINKYQKYFFIFIIIIGVGLLSLPTGAFARTLYVDTSGRDDCTSATSEDMACDSISNAVNALRNGDRLIIDRGTYNECGPFTIKFDDITIEGSSNGKPTIRPLATCDTVDRRTAFLIDREITPTSSEDFGLRIEDLIIENFLFGIRTSGDVTDTEELRDIQIQNVDFDGVGIDDLSVAGCEVDASDVLSQNQRLRIGSNILLTADDPMTNDLSVTITVVDATATTGDDRNITITESDTGNNITVAITNDPDLSDITYQDLEKALDLKSDRERATDIIQVNTSNVTSLINVSGGSANNVIALSQTNFSFGFGAMIFLQNATEININNIEATDGSIGIYIEDVNGHELQDVSLSNLMFEDLLHTGVIIRGRDNGDDIKVSNLTIDDPQGCGIVIRDIDDSSTQISNVTITRPEGRGLDLADIRDVTFRQITITEGLQEGIVLAGTENDGTEFNNITINQSESTAITIQNNDRGELSQSTISEGEEDAITIDDSEEFEIFGNTIFSNQDIGLTIEGNSDDISVYDNTIYNNGDYGLVVESSVEDGEVFSNIFYGNEGNDELPSTKQL